MTFLLRHKNTYNETFYFVSTGATHYSSSLEKTLHLISATTRDPKKARHFDSEEDAKLILARTGANGWDVVRGE
jgi:hypothetical protein